MIDSKSVKHIFPRQHSFALRPLRRSLIAGSLALAGCTSPVPAKAPREASPASTIPSAVAASAAPLPKQKREGPIVLFSVHRGGVAPFVCMAHGTFLPPDAPECAVLLAPGQPLKLDVGVGTLGEPTPFSCMDSETTYDGYAVTGADAASGQWGIAPPEAAELMAPLGDSFEATPEEASAVARALPADTDGGGSPPKFDFWLGMRTDLDGDGKDDRLFSVFDESMLRGVLSVFLGGTAGTPTIVGTFRPFFPRITGVIDLDGDGRGEVWLEGASLFEVEDSYVRAGYVHTLVTLGAPEDAERPTWACSIF